MTSNFFSRLSKQMSKSDDDSTVSHQKHESPGVCSSPNRQTTHSEALLRQTERLYTSQQGLKNSVLKRLGLLKQQDPLPSPHPPARHLKPRPAPSFRLWRMGPFTVVPPVTEETEGTERHLLSPDTVDEYEEEELHTDRRQTISPSPPASLLSSVDTETPRELRAIPFITTPDNMSFSYTCFTPFSPTTILPPQCRRVRRLPVLTANITEADKNIRGYRLQTAKHQMDAITESMNRLMHNLATSFLQHPRHPKPPQCPKSPQHPQSPQHPKPPQCPKSPQHPQSPQHPKPPRHPQSPQHPKPPRHPQSPQHPKPPRHPQSPQHPKPPRRPQSPQHPKPPRRPQSPLRPRHPKRPQPRAQKSRPHRTFVHPEKTISTNNKPDSTCRLQRADNENLEDLQPLRNPTESLPLCFKLLSSEDWMRKVEGLRCVRSLAQHHPNTLMVKLHEVCLLVIEEVKNLRSSVSCPAIDTLRSLYVYLQKDMDPQAERTGNALLRRIGQANANVFVQQQANVALEDLVKNCSPSRVLPALQNTGLKHLSAAVRVSAAQQLHLMADTMGATAVLTARQTFTQNFLLAVSKMCLDAAAEVRPHGQAILQQLAGHQDFSKLCQKFVEERDRSSLEKILRKIAK